MKQGVKIVSGYCKTDADVESEINKTIEALNKEGKKIIQVSSLDKAPCAFSASLLWEA